jgi:predicted amidohydrolase YtcJ
MMTSAKTILINGSAITIDGQDRICAAVAVTGNKILCVGSIG